MKKLLVIPFLLFTVVSLSQTVVSGGELPKVIKNDTVIFYGEVWVQSSRSEVKQQANQKTCERRLSRVHKVLNQKIYIVHQIDSLLLKIEEIENERDSLKYVFDNLTINEASNVQADLNKCTQRLTNANYQVWIYKERFKKIKKKQFLLYLVIGFETVLIIVLI